MSLSFPPDYGFCIHHREFSMPIDKEGSYVVCIWFVDANSLIKINSDYIFKPFFSLLTSSRCATQNTMHFGEP